MNYFIWYLVIGIFLSWLHVSIINDAIGQLKEKYDNMGRIHSENWWRNFILIIISIIWPIIAIRVIIKLIRRYILIHALRENAHVYMNFFVIN